MLVFRHGPGTWLMITGFLGDSNAQKNPMGWRQCTISILLELYAMELKLIPSGFY